MRIHSLLIASLLLAGLGAQTPTADNAGFGAVYRDFALDAQTGNSLHMGVAVSPASGHLFVSATGRFGLPPHRLHEFDAAGALLATRDQPAAQAGSITGMGDLDSDGLSLIGGSEVGLSVCAPDGTPTGWLRAANGMRPWAQPFAPAALQQLGAFRAVAFDPQGNGGDGSLFLANLGAPILECALDGSILRTIANGGWQVRALVLDPTTGNLWIGGDAQGRVLELDLSTGAPTGHVLPAARSGATTLGLALASGVAGHCERWDSDLLFAQVLQDAGGADRVAIQRVRLYPGLDGWEEPVLTVGTNGGPLVRGTARYGAADRLDLRVASPTGYAQGAPCWTIVNFYGDAATDAYTDLSALFPASGLLHEFRFLSGVSVPSTSVYGIVAHSIGPTVSIPLPPGLPVQAGDLLRFQSIYLEPASTHVFAATNKGHFLGIGVERGIVVSAAGGNSFNSNPATPFWQVRSDATHAHGAVLWVEISFAGASGPAALQRFDLDQDSMNDRFDGGNSPLAGAHGTYRNGSDLACGLDYAAAGVYVDPLLHTGAGQSGGFAATLLPGRLADASTIRFAFTQFGPGKTFQFDCDTDGGLPGGDGQVGAVVRVGTANSGVLLGLLQQDPNDPQRAVVFFP